MPKDNGEPINDIKCKCGQPGCLDICPYDSELFDMDNECTCCNVCRKECADDI